MNIVFNSPKIYQDITGIIQVGACIGEECSYMDKSNIRNQILIEPIPDLFPALIQTASKYHRNDSDYIRCYNCAISDFNGESDFHISTGSYCSSSLLEFTKEALNYGTELQTSKIIKVPTSKLDSLLINENVDLSKFNMLYIDVQGSEANVIYGAEETLQRMKYLFVEVNHVQLYENCMLFDKFNELIESRGFHLLHNKINTDGTQSDVLYMKK